MATHTNPTFNIVDQVKETDEMLDKTRISNLKDIESLLHIRRLALIGEERRLTTKYGEGYPGLNEIKARIAFDGELFKGLAMEISHAEIVVPESDKKTWRIHGRVFGKQNQPMPNVKVVLTDGNRRALKNIEPVMTDEKGYYSITVEENILGELQQKEIFIGIQGKKEKLPEIDTRRLSPKISTTEYRELVFTE